jgi:hypothetical protein
LFRKTNTRLNKTYDWYKMGYEAILIGIGGIVLSVLTYFAGVIRTDRRHKAQAKDNRIDAFERAFFDSYGGGGYILRHLIPTGINNLVDDDEIKIALDRLQNRIGHHPLRDWNQRIEEIGYKSFFQHTAGSGMRLGSASIEILIAQQSGDDKK